LPNGNGRLTLTRPRGSSLAARKWQGSYIPYNARFNEDIMEVKGLIAIYKQEFEQLGNRQAPEASG